MLGSFEFLVIRGARAAYLSGVVCLDGAKSVTVRSTGQCCFCNQKISAPGNIGR